MRGSELHTLHILLTSQVYACTSSKNGGRMPSLMSESNSKVLNPGGGRVRRVISSYSVIPSEKMST